jgi:hypothetical protein
VTAARALGEEPVASREPFWRRLAR